MPDITDKMIEAGRDAGPQSALRLLSDAELAAIYRAMKAAEEGSGHPTVITDDGTVRNRLPNYQPSEYWGAVGNIFD